MVSLFPGWSVCGVALHLATRYATINFWIFSLFFLAWVYLYFSGSVWQRVVRMFTQRTCTYRLICLFRKLKWYFRVYTTPISVNIQSEHIKVCFPYISRVFVQYSWLNIHEVHFVIMDLSSHLTKSRAHLLFSLNTEYANIQLKCTCISINRNYCQHPLPSYWHPIWQHLIQSRKFSTVQCCQLIWKHFSKSI